jgi:plastocyanin
MKRKDILILLAVLILIIGVVSSTVYFSNKYIKGLNNKQKTSGCEAQSSTKYNLDIKNNVFTQDKVTAKLCDSITITNYDDRSRLIAFGDHDEHKTYNGIEEETLTQNQSFTITLDETGEFTIHDHNQDSVEATFRVTN